MKQIRFSAIDISECAVFIALMVAGAFIQIPFPLVPLTFQTVIAVLSGLLLGAKKGAISMSVYCFAGLIGLPVFSAGGGIYYVLKPSFGYIIGFILSAVVGGLIVRKSFKSFLLAAISAVIADYVIGIPYCLIAAKLTGVENLFRLFLIGNLIYLPKDIVLGILASFVAFTVRPKMRKDKAQLQKDN